MLVELTDPDNATLFENLTSSNMGSSVQPAVDLDLAGGGFEVAMLARLNNNSLRRTTLIGSVTNPTLVIEPVIGEGVLSNPPDADQPRLPTQKQDIDTGDTRFSGNVVLQNGKLWAVQSGGLGGKSVIRFLVVDADSNAVVQNTIITDTDLAYYYPSIAVNDDAADHGIRFDTAFAAAGQLDGASHVELVGR